MVVRRLRLNCCGGRVMCFTASISPFPTFGLRQRHDTADLSPWMNAPWNSATERVRRRTPALVRLGLATMIITPGETVRRQAIEAFLLPPPVW